MKAYGIPRDWDQDDQSRAPKSSLRRNSTRGGKARSSQHTAKKQATRRLFKKAERRAAKEQIIEQYDCDCMDCSVNEGPTH